MIENISTNDGVQLFFGTHPIYSASVKVTRCCNLACKQCYVNTDRYKSYSDELTTKKIKDVIDQLYDMGCLRLFLNGGEPLIHKDILEIYRYATDKGFRISMSTNGYTCDQEFLDRIAEYNPELFQVSIDGLEETHDAIRNCKGSFIKAKNTLSMAVKKFIGTETNVVMASTLMIDNYMQMESLYEMAFELDVPTFAVIPIMPTGKAKYADDISVEDKNMVFNSLANLYVTKYSKTEISLIVPPGLIPEVLKNSKYSNGYTCSFPYILGIDSNGDAAPCDGLLENKELHIGNINSENIDSIWNNPIVQDILAIDYTNLQGVCSKCIYVEKCQGGCRAYAYKRYNNFFMPEPLCQDFYEKGLFPKHSLKSKQLVTL